MHDQLTDPELLSLQAFLDSPELGGLAMDVAAMEGYFAALAIAPRTVMPSQWMPWIWDMDRGETQPAFVDADEANVPMQLIFRQYNRVVGDFMETPESFHPIYDQHPQWNVSAWCRGFMLAVTLSLQDWTPLLVSQPAWIAPFNRLGTPEGMELTAKEGDAGFWGGQVAASLQKIHAFWLEQRAAVPAGEVVDDFHFGTPAQTSRVRSGPKVGRNDPCPCGSGLKFKKCCALTDRTLH